MFKLASLFLGCFHQKRFEKELAKEMSGEEKINSDQENNKQQMLLNPSMDASQLIEEKIEPPFSRKTTVDYRTLFSF